ncbi:MAG: phosphotransferase [Tatlockia sp.]
MHQRENALHQWLEEVLATNQYQLVPLTGDASFRRYFRLHQEKGTRIVMDAPPMKEDIAPFIAVAKLLQALEVQTPTVHAFDKKQGFALLDDFGDTLLLNQLTDQTSDFFYTEAMKVLTRLQVKAPQLPVFDKAFILQELAVFREWFLQSYLQLNLSDKEEILLEKTFDLISEALLQQPRVLIHRDFHSRNIMLNHNTLGIIDFQDAMQGPFTYDLVSLLKDCYIQWPIEKVLHWVDFFYKQTPLTQQYSWPDFVRAFDYCGLQRHLKVLGVFSRLHLRDNKSGYLKDLPLTLHYVMACLEGHEELQPFYSFMQSRIDLP